MEVSVRWEGSLSRFLNLLKVIQYCFPGNASVNELMTSVLFEKYHATAAGVIQKC